MLERTGLDLDQPSTASRSTRRSARNASPAPASWGSTRTRLNVNGGAIAIGHPLGATGVRLTVTLARELQRSGGRYGIASACIGGGQGIALLIENLQA